MAWFGIGEEIKDAAGGITNVTAGLRHMITGDIPPEAQIELNKIDNDFTVALANAEKGVPWWKSSRSIVLMWLVFNATLMMWSTVILEVDFKEYWVEMMGFLTTSAVVAFFSSKGAEFWKHGRMV